MEKGDGKLYFLDFILLFLQRKEIRPAFYTGLISEFCDLTDKKIP